MTAEDVPFGLSVSTQAGWNQREVDWRRFLELEPEGCFLAERDGRPVGTTCTFRFGPVAWVAMVLVEEACRQQGIGTALLKYALAYLDGGGVHTVRLDATPLGRPLYEKLGFTASYTLGRFEGVLPARRPAGRPQRLGLAYLLDVTAFDQRATGTNREALVLRLLLDWPTAVRLVVHDGEVQGYLVARPGRVAVQIGPCLATPEVGELLLADACARFAGRRVYLDIPLENKPAVQVAEAAGLTVQRPLLRMSRGEPVTENLESLWASSGPEKG
jgi:GNAT superfamily N-acetyltransferase